MRIALVNVVHPPIGSRLLAATGRRAWAVSLVLLVCGCPSSEPVGPLDRGRIAAAAPSLDRKVLAAALDAFDCATEKRKITRRTLAVIDFSRPSVERRLWAIDLETREVVRMHVAHGQGSGGLWATAFSNDPGSNQSSLGLFRGGETYEGKHGRSLRLDGLEPANSRARERAIVIHGADYATPGYALQHLRLGRSWGCPAVAPSLADTLIDRLEGGGALFAWFPDESWLVSSPWLRCGT